MKYITPYIAAQCPSAGGNAVFQARGVLSLLGYSPDFDDYAACALVQSPWRQGAEEAVLGADILVYPNPTEGEFTIEVSNAYVGGMYNVYNALGVKVLEGCLSDNNHTSINMSGSVSGVYVLEIGVKKVKLIIQ